MESKALRDSQTIVELFFGRVQETPDDIAYEHKVDGEWRATTYAEYGRLVEDAALGLHDFGVSKGDCVAIWGDTMPEWTILDLGAVTAGAHVAGIYQTSTPEQAAYILQDSEARVVCVDTPERLQTALSIRDKTPKVEEYILWSGEAPETDATVVTYADLIERSERLHEKDPGKIEELKQAVSPDDYAILIYTSGTTGEPKGVVLTHGNCTANAIRLFDTGMLEVGDSSLAYLPMSHVAEYTLFLGRIYGNVRGFFCPDFQMLGEVIRDKAPTLLIGVPRVFEKLHQRVVSSVDQLSPGKQKLFWWAVMQGQRVAKAKEKQEPIPPGLLITYRLADRLVLSKIRQQLGGNVRLMGCAAAPIDAEIIYFFKSLGVLFLEGYGLSESCGASHANRPEAYRVGTVGRPVEGYECKIAEDGEVLLRGPAVFRGYLNKPDATAEALDDEGWLHTGDIGEIDEEGFLRITDRKKNLLITAGGKNVAPAGIELLLKRDSLVSQVVVLGDRKPYLVALVTINPEVAEADQLTPDQIDERVGKIIEESNKELARYEQIKRFRVLDRDFTIEDGEMTATMKIKRNVVAKNFGHLIDEMYSDQPAQPEKVAAT